MAGILIDCTSSPPADAMRAAGVTCVSRYLAPAGLAKVVGVAEYQALRSNGFQVMLNWENFAFDWLRGTGTSDATEAARQARALGYPTGRTIYGSADLDMTSAQWSAGGHAYAVAFAATLHAAGYQAGVYGPVDVLDWCAGTGLFSGFWQSMSAGFSGGRNAARGGHTQIWQRRQQTIGGADCDVSDVFTSDFGQAGAPMGNVIIVHKFDEPGVDWVTDGITRTRIVDLANTQNLLRTIDPNANVASQSVSSIIACGVDTAMFQAMATLTDAQVSAIAAQVAATHDALTSVDEPVIEEAIRTVLHGS